MPSRPNKPVQVPTATDADNRAIEARRLLEDPMMVEAFDQLKKTYTQAWQDSQYGDTEGRERAFRMIHAAEKVQQQLHEIVLNGKIESDRVKRTVAGN